jgi:hypothetical protein
MLKTAYLSIVPPSTRQRMHQLRVWCATAVNSVRSSFQKLRQFIRRIRLATGYYRSLPQQIFQRAVLSREDSNFTYDLTPQNRAYLASFIAVVAGIDTESAACFIAEPKEIRGRLRCGLG